MGCNFRTRMSKKILFISHSTSRTGAPVLLLQFLRWLKTNTDLSFATLVGDAGPLFADFEALAETRLLNPRLTMVDRVTRKLVGSTSWIRVMEERQKKWCRNKKYDLVYSNTICALDEMELLSQAGYPVVCHVHELDYALQLLVGYEKFGKTLPFIHHFIAGSKAVHDYLSTRWLVPESKLSLVHEFTVPRKENTSLTQARSSTRAELGLAHDDILVGACGTLEWRKGSDLFIQIASEMRKNPKGSKLRFLWVGGKTQFESMRFLHDMNKCGLGEIVTVVETCPNYVDYLSAMDIFALTSREDPFPLVMLDAASLGLPIVCFDSSGGGPEFVEQDAGLVAPYLNIEAFASHLLTLAEYPEVRRRMGEKGAEKVRTRYTIDRQAPKLLQVISDVCGRTAGN